jgi:hypothetical protein
VLDNFDLQGLKMRIKDGLYSVEIPEIPEVDPMLATFILYFRTGGGELKGVWYNAFGAEIEAIGFTAGSDGLGTSIFAEATDALEQGIRIMLDSGGDLVTIDVTGNAVYTYTPPGSWIATSPQKIGDTIYWWEWESTTGATTNVRLMSSDSAKWTAPVEIQAEVIAAVTASPVTWEVPVGPEFTVDRTALWISANDGEVVRRARIVLPLSGGAALFRATESESAGAGQRAGFPLSASLGIALQGDGGPATESDELPVVSWDGTKDDDPAAWAAIGSVVDMAPDPGSTSFVWVLRETPMRQIERWSAAGSLIEAVAINAPVFPVPIGLHILADPVLVVVEEGG